MIKKLNSTVKFYSGLIVSRERTYSSSSCQYRVLNYRCIDENGNIDINKLDVLDLNKNIDEKYITKENDIVIKLVYPFKAVLISKESEGLLITSNFCKIVCLSEIIPDYLITYLNSKVIEKKLMIESKNQIINQISIKDLERLEIEICSIKKQKAISNIYKNYIKRIQLTKMILNKEQTIIKNIYK